MAFRRKHLRQPGLERLQPRELMAIDLGGFSSPGPIPTYSIDGTGNNVSQVEWGSTNEQLLRLVKAQYADGISTPNGADRPSARAISNAIGDQGSQDIISDRNLAAFVYAWGQFIDHDIGLTPTGGSEKLSIPVPKGDPYFDPTGTGTKVMTTSRSVFDPATGTSAANPRQQVNTITAWLDGSMIYGSDSKTADALRTLQGGKLKMDAAGLLPLNNAANFPNGRVSQVNDAHRVPDDQLFAAGDVRANENIELTSIQTLFAREHNRIAADLARQNPKLSDQELYLRARAMVIGEIQAITYNEWLPAVLGPNAIKRYAGYNPKANPELTTEFSTAAFRFGHSLLGDDVEFLNSDGRPIASTMSLSDAFFNPTVLSQVPIDSIFKYLSSDPASELDTQVVGSIRNFLFGPPGAGGFDLASLNIQRGRDHGLADYNTVRVAVGLPRVTTFAGITKNVDLQNKLQQLYGSVDKIDLWVGVLAEDHIPGTSVGPTASRIIADQFQRMRDGDRFWYQNEFSGQLLRNIDTTRLSDIIARNTALKNIQPNAFVFNSSIEGTVFADRNRDGRRGPIEEGLGGWTVALVGSDGMTVATTLTRPDGRYRLDVQSGVRTDRYSIKLIKDNRGKLLDKPPQLTAAITRGDQFLQNLDFAVPPPPTMKSPALTASQGTNAISPVTASSTAAPAVAISDSSAVDQVFSDAAKKRRVG
jgi:hypothetical protein